MELTRKSTEALNSSYFLLCGEITESSNISTPSSFEVEIRKHYVNETLPTNETPIVISPNHFNVLSGSPFCLPSPKSQLENAKVEILVSKQNSVEAMRIWINSDKVLSKDILYLGVIDMSSHKFRNISSAMSPEKFEQEKKIIGILVVVGYLFIVLVISGYLFFFSQSSAKKKRSS